MTSDLVASDDRSAEASRDSSTQLPRSEFTKKLRFRYGMIVVEPDSEWVQPRWWPRLATVWDVARDSVVRPLAYPSCQLFYSFPRRAPGFMAVNYLVCGPGTSYSMLRRAVSWASFIAEMREANAIVCQAYSDRLTPRLMGRWGYVQHASSLGGSNYIRRIDSNRTR